MPSALTLALIALCALPILVLGIRWRAMRSKERFTERHVRHLEASGEFVAAGSIVLDQGAPEEALRLFERAGDNENAMLAALQLGEYQLAAEHAEAAGQLESAARFFSKAGETESAARVLRTLEKYEEAVARLLELDPPPYGEIATLWEAEYLSIFPRPGETLDRLGRQRIWRAAQQAGEAYERAGDRTRGRHFLKTAEQFATRTESPLPPEQVADDTRGFADETFVISAGDTPNLGSAGLPAAALRNEPSASAPFHAVTPIADIPAVRPPRSSDLLEPRAPVLPKGPQEELPPDADTRRYVLGAKLGEGGMAAVYEATDKVLDRTVGLKLLPAEIAADDMAQRQFVREAKAAARLNHHNIITIHDVGVLDGRPFICMEHIEGVTVWEKIVSSPPQGLDLRTVHDIAMGLVKALEYAHDRGVIHRDVKPSNLMWSDNGLVKLTDFGIAAVRARHEANALSGTPAYMSPEQLNARKEDERSDIFAAGVTIFEVLTGYLPFHGTRRDIEAPSAKALRPSTPTPLARLLERCLSLRVQDRPSEAAEVRAELESMRWIIEAAHRQEGSRRAASALYTPQLGLIPVPSVMRILQQHGDPNLREVRRVRMLFESALRDPRPQIRQVAMRSFPGPWEGVFMDYLLQLATDEDDAVQETAVALLSGQSVRAPG